MVFKLFISYWWETSFNFCRGHWKPHRNTFILGLHSIPGFISSYAVLVTSFRCNIICSFIITIICILYKMSSFFICRNLCSTLYLVGTIMNFLHTISHYSNISILTFFTLFKIYYIWKTSSTSKYTFRMKTIMEIFFL